MRSASERLEGRKVPVLPSRSSDQGRAEVVVIVGLREAAEYMTARGRPTTERGLHSLLTRGRHEGYGRRGFASGRPGRPPYVFTPEELDRLIERVRPYRRRERVG